MQTTTLTAVNQSTHQSNMSNKIKGDLYELYIRNLLSQQDTKIYVWLWKDAPECELRIFGWLGDWNEFRLQRKENKINNLPDLGCDILVKNNDKYEIIQCKNYAQNNSVRIEDLAGFFMMMTHQLLSQNPNFLGGRVYYTSKLSRHLSSHQTFKQLQYIRQTFDTFELEEEASVEQTDAISNSYHLNLMDHPFDYQLEAYEQLKNKHRTVLQLPCGMGKTLISMLVAKDYDNVVIVSPLKEHCLQNLERYKNEDTFLAYQSLLVDSDGTRNMDEIVEFISTNSKTILSVSYKSVDVLNEVIQQLTNCIVIFDEFHNMSCNDVMEMETEPELEEELTETGSEDELTEQKQTPINKLLYNPNVRMLFMSATPRLFEWDDDSLNSEIFGNIDYSYEMGDAIRKGYICDYEIYIPHLSMCHSDTIVTNIQKEMQQPIDLDKLGLLQKIHFIVRGCLENGSKKCICYFNTQEDAKQFKELLLKCNNEYYYLDLFVETILSDDSHKNRRTKLDGFKEWNGLAFLCSVRILDECIDIPSCDSIFMTTTCDSKIKNIQRLSRANRKDHNNFHKISRIYIWTEEHNDMLNMISHLKEFDNSFTCQKVKIINTEKDATKSIVLNRETEDKEEYKEMDNLVIGMKKILTWDEKLEQVKQYIDEHGKLPSPHNKNKEIKSLGVWMCNQKKNYKNKTKIMKNEAICNIWTVFIHDYAKCFKSNEEKWFDNLEKVKQYVDEHGKLPSRDDKNEDIKHLGIWICTQTQNYKNKKHIMKNNEIYNIWTQFIHEYADFFKSNEEIWYDILETITQYIAKYGKLPSSHAKNKDIKCLGKWISTQKINYKNKTMSNDKINIWTDFINEHAEIFKTNEEFWYQNLERVKQYIVECGQLPSQYDNNKEIKFLGYWIMTQKMNYKNKTNIMKNEEFFDAWTDLIYECTILFKSNEEIWYQNLEQVKQYITKNGTLPSSNAKNKDIKCLGKWISTQKINCNNKTKIMKNNEIYNTWTDFTKEHAELFKSNEEVWNENLEKVKQFILENGKLPSSYDKNKDIKSLNIWISTQKNKYKNRTQIMSNDEIYNTWTVFMHDYAQFF